MQNNWLRLVRGCLVIRLGGDYIERFINMCRMHDIDLWEIRRENDICMCEVYASDFLKMPPLLRKTGTKANVMKKRGLPFYIPFIKKRIIFFVALLMCLTLLNFVTEYIWAIEFIGNLQVSDDEMSDFLRRENIHYGMKKKYLDCEEEEKKLRETFQNVTWTSIYFEGTKLCIEVKENEKSEPEMIEVKGTDIIANESGTITSIVTRNGVPKVKAGDLVEKGQILVAGQVPVYDESQTIVDYQIYDADADICIMTPIEYKCSIKKSYPVIHYSGRNMKTVFLEMCGYHIDGMFLYEFFHKNDNALYETVTEKHQIVLLDNIYLPMYYGEINRKKYYIRYHTYTEAEMKNILSENYKKIIFGLQEKGVQIVEKSVKMVQNRDGLELCGDFLVIKPTGESIVITDKSIEDLDQKE